MDAMRVGPINHIALIKLIYMHVKTESDEKVYKSVSKLKIQIFIVWFHWSPAQQNKMKKSFSYELKLFKETRAEKKSHHKIK